MRPLLVAGLVVSLTLSGLAAWWPQPDDTTGLLPAARVPGRVAGGPGPAAAADLARAPVRPAPVPSTQPGAAAPPVVVATPPAARLATATAATTVATATTAATATTTDTTATATATLPTRAADWPAPGAAALAAWQGVPAAKPAGSASANPGASDTPPLPVFPYQWIGQLDDGGAPQVLLASAQRSVGVRRGAVLDGRWRLDRAPGGPWKATHLPSGLVVVVRGAPSNAEP